MFKISIAILFVAIVLCTGLPHRQKLYSEEKSDYEADKYLQESQQDFDRSFEIEKSQRRKSKKIKEKNRRSFGSNLPAKDSDNYKQMLEDLITKSEEKHKFNNLPYTEVEKTIDDGNENDSDDLKVEEIEVVVEHFIDTNSSSNETSDLNPDTLTQTSKDYHTDLREISNKDAIKNRDISSSLPDNESDMNMPGEHEISRSGDIGALRQGHFIERKVLGPSPVNRYSEVVIPHYRTILTNRGLVVSPAVYKVQTSTPVISPVTIRNWIPHRNIVQTPYTNKGGHRNREMKLIDDYNDYSGNTYSYSPLHSPEVDNNKDILSKLVAASIQPQLGTINPIRDDIYHRAYYSQLQRYSDDSYKPFMRIRR